MKQPDNPSLDSLQELMQQIGVQVLRGIKHGHFDYQISGSSNANGIHNVILKAGLTYRYQLNRGDLPKNLTPLATFYPLAHYPPAATSATSQKDARVDTERNDDESNE